MSVKNLRTRVVRIPAQPPGEADGLGDDEVDENLSPPPSAGSPGSGRSQGSGALGDGAVPEKGVELEDPTSAGSKDKKLLAETLSTSANSLATTTTKGLKVQTAVFLLALIFFSALAALLFVYYSFPQLEASEAEHVKFPKDIEDAKQLGIVLSRYKDRYFSEVLGGVFITYLFLQTFAIPGSIFLSIVSGYLFEFPIALLLICFCSATGASFCYLLSYLAGRPLVHKYLPQRALEWSQKVDRHKNNILSYIVFLRITPFLPNWFINIVSPVIGVRLVPFWLGTFIGVAPPSFIAIQAGTTLQQMTSSADALTVQSISLLVIFAFLSLLPVLLRNRKGLNSYFSGACDSGSQAPSSSSSASSASTITPSVGGKPEIGGQKLPLSVSSSSTNTISTVTSPSTSNPPQTRAETPKGSGKVPKNPIEKF